MITSVDYLDGYQYAGGILQFFPHAEGYVKATLSQKTSKYQYDYVYNYTDHLGNIRVSYTKDPASNELKILEENHYYPFGLKHKTYANIGLKISNRQELSPKTGWRITIIITHIQV